VNSNWTTKRLIEVAEIIPSGVDKKSNPDETPVRLCNYLDVYNNDEIGASLPFSSATASVMVQSELEDRNIGVSG
jgi:type I restriction enzyme S subunit